jgi:hypothetical protein
MTTSLTQAAPVPLDPWRELQPADRFSRESIAEAHTDNYRPPWLHQEFLPRQEAQRPAYPWCTVGKVLVGSPSGSKTTSGVLVGPNLVLAAGEIASWGMGNWSAEFVPGYRGGGDNPRPFGSSFVERIHGYHRESGTSGFDYVICKLYQPLGQALGWMGTQSLGDMDFEAVVHASCGRAGEPFWFFAGDGPWVAGDRGLVDLVRFGLDRWRP